MLGDTPRPRPRHDSRRTSCGRDLTVGRLALGDARHPAQRIFVDLGDCRGCEGAEWAGLTVTEARWLAAALLAQATAAAAEHDGEDSPAAGRTGDASHAAGPTGGAGTTGDASHAAAGTTGDASHPAAGRTGDAGRTGGASHPAAGRVLVGHASGDAYAIAIRGHDLLVDQPLADGGGDAAVTPTELLVASLASCVAFYAGRFLARHGLDRSGLAVDAEFTMASDRPARVSGVRMRISAPGVPPERRDALLAVASHCTVHNTLRSQTDVTIQLG